MNIGNVEKIYFAIGIKFLGFISFARDFVAKSSHLVPGIINDTIDIPLG